MKDKKGSPLNQALITWCETKGISATRLGKKMQITYFHAWRLLSGKSLVTAETLGRFALAYGYEAVGELLALAKANGQDNTFINNPDTS